ncbi:MAG: VF530 family DNA-binding protein [Flavobacteriales bacterium]
MKVRGRRTHILKRRTWSCEKRVTFHTGNNFASPGNFLGKTPWAREKVEDLYLEMKQE